MDFLVRESLHFSIDSDGDVKFVVSGDEELDDIVFYYGVSDLGTFWFLSKPARQFPLTAGPGLLNLCNQWNVDKRWPKASLQNGTGPSQCSVSLDYAFPASDDLPPAFIDSIVGVLNSAALQFWRLVKLKVS